MQPPVPTSARGKRAVCRRGQPIVDFEGAVEPEIAERCDPQIVVPALAHLVQAAREVANVASDAPKAARVEERRHVQQDEWARIGHDRLLDYRWGAAQVIKNFTPLRENASDKGAALR